MDSWQGEHRGVPFRVTKVLGVFWRVELQLGPVITPAGDVEHPWAVVDVDEPPTSFVEAVYLATSTIDAIEDGEDGPVAPDAKPSPNPNPTPVPNVPDSDAPDDSRPDDSPSSSSSSSSPGLVGVIVASVAAGLLLDALRRWTQ